MFCPECGALSFPDSKGWIKCPDYKCGYHGPLDNKMKDPVTGEEIDLGMFNPVQKQKLENLR